MQHSLGFPETLPLLLWITLRPCCWQFLVELFPDEEMVPMKTANSVSCGLCKVIRTLFLGRHLFIWQMLLSKVMYK